MDKFWYIPEGGVQPEEFRPPPKRRLRVKVNIPYQDDLPHPNILTIPCLDLPVPEALGGLFKQWCHRQAIIISAPTGAQKTTYILRIAKYAKAHRQHVLFLAHRKLIVEQQKGIMVNSLGSRWADVEDKLALELTSEFHDCNLTMMSYQAFAFRRKKMDLSKFDYVICDECHYFSTDALFSETADELLNQIPQLFAKAVRIYMSATPEAVLEDIVRVEKAAQKRPCNRACWREGCDKLLMYQFPNHFEGLQLRYFKEPAEIADLAKSHPSEKFVVFVSSREDLDDGDPNAYLTAFKKANISVSYLDRDEKNSATWAELRDNQKFESQALVTTSVIDCGVNVMDKSLKHIVIETTDRTELIQMLGRRRRDRNEPVCVYIRAINSGTMGHRLKKVKEWLAICDRADRSSSRHPDYSLLLAGWNDKSEDRPYEKLLVPYSSGGFRVKRTAYHALCWQQGTLKKLLHMSEEFGDDSALPRLVHEWLDDPGGYRKENWLHYDTQQKAREELVQFLKRWLDVPLNEENEESFKQELRGLLSPLVMGAHDTTREIGYRALSNRLEELGLPYQIVKKGSSYCVEQINNAKFVEE